MKLRILMKKHAHIVIQIIFSLFDSYFFFFKSMRRSIIGYFARELGGIPVERAQDLGRAGKGRIIGFENGVLKVCQ